MGERTVPFDTPSSIGEMKESSYLDFIAEYRLFRYDFRKGNMMKVVGFLIYKVGRAARLYQRPERCLEKCLKCIYFF